MAPIPYSKPALDHNSHLQLLKNRGLKVKENGKALFLLESIGYYRLSGYWYPFLSHPKSAHQFKQDATFEASFNLYCFDRELRKLISAELEKIEIGVRAKMVYNLSHSQGPFWFTDSTLFSNLNDHNSSISKLTQEYQRSDEQFLKAFRLNYTNPLPPSWMVFEINSFGGLSYFYKNLKAGHDKRSIANYFGLDETTFQSWLHSLVYVRNVCAHHARLWNRIMRISPNLPNSPANLWLQTHTVLNTQTGQPVSVQNRSFYVLSMMIYLMDTINPHHRIRQKIFGLLRKYSNVDPSAMGFPPNWKTEPLWKLKKWPIRERIKRLIRKIQKTI